MSARVIPLNPILCMAGLMVLPTLKVFSQRQPNTSLQVPLASPVYQYDVINRFPGLSFLQPLAVVSAPGETDRLFVVERAGRIYSVSGLSTVPEKRLFLDIRDRVVASRGEEGLLGLAFHPGFRANDPNGSNFIYVFYTTEVTSPASPEATVRHDRLSRFELDPLNPGQALSSSEQPLISQLDQDWNHNGGDLHFGPDGYLYVSTGDEGGGGDVWGNSRSIDRDFFSAILRMDVDRRPGALEPNEHPGVHRDTEGRAFYGVPPDNPFHNRTEFNGELLDPAAVRTEFWAVGLRNPWRFSFDAWTGDLFCADVGQNLYEEVNRIEKGGDYGWNLREGFHAYNNGSIPNGVVLSDPILEYPHSNGPMIPGGRAEGRSITGGVVYRGNQLPGLHGFYLFGDYASQRLFAFRYSQGAVDQFQQIAAGVRPVGFGTDPSNGEVLIADYGGTIRQLVTGGAQNEPPATLSETGAFAEVSSLTPNPGILAYEINVPFWSDHALKSRWFSVPDPADTIGYHPENVWVFPAGTVWIKQFELETTNGVAASRRRLETRFLVKNDYGVHGFTYRWNEAQDEAFLLPPEGMTESIDLYDSEGTWVRSQTWQYPARSQCQVCHTEAGGYALGFNTLQLNRVREGEEGSLNQLLYLDNLGYLDPSPEAVHTLPTLAAAEDGSISLERRVRSYLQANCVQCHQPAAGGLGGWDARIGTRTVDSGLIDGALRDPQGNPENRVIVPGDPDRSMLLQRLETTGPGRMPPLASSAVDTNGVELVRMWITGVLADGYERFETWQDQRWPDDQDPNRGAKSDPDEDRASNYYEWLTGTDAKDPLDFWKGDIERGETGVWIRFQELANRGFVVEATTNLFVPETWRPLNVPGNRPIYPAQSESKVLVIPLVPGQGRYFRIRLLEP